MTPVKHVLEFNPPGFTREIHEIEMAYAGEHRHTSAKAFESAAGGSI